MNPLRWKRIVCLFCHLAQPGAWQQTELSGSHAGILTRRPFFFDFKPIGRGPTVFDAFLCQPFNPPVLPVADEESA